MPTNPSTPQPQPRVTGYTPNNGTCCAQLKGGDRCLQVAAYWIEMAVLNNDEPQRTLVCIEHAARARAIQPDYVLTLSTYRPVSGVGGVL